MRRYQPFILIAVIIGIAIAAYLMWTPQARAPAPSAPTSPATGLTAEAGRYLFNITLHTPDEIAGLLSRAEELSRTRHADIRHTGIALILHGPEIEIFARKNYSRYQQTVDLAAQLDARRIVEVKMCRSEMKRLGITEEEVPAFIELVPYGPDEEKRLLSNGYIYL